MVVVVESSRSICGGYGGSHGDVAVGGIVTIAGLLFNTCYLSSFREFLCQVKLSSDIKDRDGHVEQKGERKK